MKKSEALTRLRRKIRPNLLEHGPDANVDGNFWNPKIGFASDLERAAYELYLAIDRAESKDEILSANFEIQLFSLELSAKTPQSQFKFIQDEINRVARETKRNQDVKDEIMLAMILEDFIKRKDPATIEDFLINKPRLNPEIWHIIAAKGTPEIAEMFLKYYRQESKNADDNPLLTARQQPKGDTPIFSAVRHQNAAMFFYLRSLGANVSQKNSLDENLLHTLCQSIPRDPPDLKAEHAILNELTLTYPGITDELNSKRETALLLALTAGKYQMSRELIHTSPTSYYRKGGKSIVGTVHKLQLNDDAIQAVQAAELLLLLDERREPPERLANSKEKVFFGDEENLQDDKVKLKKILQDSLPKIFEKSYGDAFDEKKCQEMISQWDEDFCRLILQDMDETIVQLEKEARLDHGEFSDKRKRNLETFFLPMLHVRLNEFNRNKPSLATIPKALLSAIIAGDEKNIQIALNDMKLTPQEFAAAIDSTLVQARNMARHMENRTAYYRGINFIINQLQDRELPKQIFEALFITDQAKIPTPPMSFCLRALIKSKESKDEATHDFNLHFLVLNFKSAYEKKETDALNSCTPFIKDILLHAALMGDLQCVIYVCSHFSNNPNVPIHQITGEILAAFFNNPKTSPEQHYIPDLLATNRDQCIKFLTSIASFPNLPIDSMPEAMRPFVADEIVARKKAMPIDDAKIQANSTNLAQAIKSTKSAVSKLLGSLHKEKKAELKSKEPETALETCWHLFKVKDDSLLHRNRDANASCLVIFRNFIDALATKNNREAINILLAGINLISQDKNLRELFLRPFLAILTLPPDTKDVLQAFRLRQPEIMDNLSSQYDKFQTFLISNTGDQQLFNAVSDKMKLKTAKELGMWSGGEKKKEPVTTETPVLAETKRAKDTVAPPPGGTKKQS